MAERISLGFRTDQLSSDRQTRQLVVGVSREVREIATRREPGLLATLRALSNPGRAEAKVVEMLEYSRVGGLSFAVDAAAIGRARLSNKQRYLRGINAVLASLAGTTVPLRRGENLLEGSICLDSFSREETYGRTSVSLSASLRLPTGLSDAALARAGLREMALATNAIRYRGMATSTTGLRTVVNRQGGVLLSQGPNSFVSTLGYEPDQGNPTLQLSGNTIAAPHEPLIYLMGMTALALAPPDIADD